MVRSDKTLAAKIEEGRHNSRNALVDCFNSFDSGSNDSGVPNHVGVGAIQNDQVVTCHSREHLVSNEPRAHFWLQIVAHNFWRRHYLPILACERALDPTIEEISDMRIFLGFGDAQL